MTLGDRLVVRRELVLAAHQGGAGVDLQGLGIWPETGSVVLSVGWVLTGAMTRNLAVCSLSLLLVAAGSAGILSVYAVHYGQVECPN